MKGFKFKKTLAIILAIVLVIGISAGTAILVDKKNVPAMTTIKNGLSAYELASENGYTGTMQEWLKSLQGKSAYEIAVDGGYKGTESEWTTALTKLVNSNPVGIKTASFNNNGELVLTLSDDTNVNLGKAVGVDGKDGVNGTNGKDGKNGTDGKDGVGITDVDINSSGELVLSFSDKKTVNLGKVVGTSGMNGLSAYEIAVLTGKTTATSEEEWIESLKGAKGDTGAQGPKGETGAQGPRGETGAQGLKGDKGDTGATGNDGATPYIKNGNWWIGTADTGISAQGPKGETGPTGAAGVTPHIDTNGNWWIDTVDTGIRANGKSAYEVALENNPNLTYDNWLESLKGSTGANGKSAYELALETGLISSTISVADWLESLKGTDGDDGISPVVRINSTTNEWEISIDGGINFTSTNVKATGEKGADGQNGSNGEKGADGISPKIRINAETNEWEVSIDNGDTYVTTGVKATGAKGDAGANGNDGSNGKDGLTPEIKDGIWWIGDKNTGITAEGKNGTNGKDAVAPQIRIDAATNMWEISTDGGNTFVSTNVKATGDKGADGQNGVKGDTGESAFEIAKRLGLTNKDNETAWIESLKGEKGDIGATGPQGNPGKDGVGIDNITLLNGVMTITLTNSEKVYKFENLKGADGITPQLIIENGKWKVSYDNGVTYTELGDAKGSDGITPTITDDGYWKFGDNKTSFKAVAVDGQNGITPQLKIENDKWYVSYDHGTSFVELGTAKGDKGNNGENGISPTIKDGYWYIGEQNTNVKAQGVDGTNGTNGENGITPILKIENDYWFVSYDNGNNYTSLNTKAVGENGQKGDKGTTPLLKIGEDNYWYVSYDNGENYSSLNVKATGANGINGSNGQNGTNGENGITPILKIENDYWYVSYDNGNSYSSLNVKATGNAGQNGTNGNDGATPEIKDGYWYINNQSTGVKALGVDGKDGKTPYIKNGTWWIGDEDTEIAVTGQNGENGKDGKTPEIGANNNWWIDGVDTGKKAVAQDGANGQNGADGDGIVGITVNENNYLVIDMKYGEDIIIEKSIVGADGKDGNGIKSISLTANYELVIVTDNGTTNLGPIRGPQGPQGIEGVAGANGLTPILSLDENGNLSVKYGEDGTLTVLGNVKGPKGDKGDTGSQGPKGDKGDKGDTGRGIAKTEIINGHLWITYTDDLENPVDLGSVLNENVSISAGTYEITSGDFTYVLLDDGTYGIKASKDFNLTELVIPSTFEGINITQILDKAFINKTSVTSLTIPETIINIGQQAFKNCTNLTEITIPSNVNFIGAYAFYNSGLTSAAFADTSMVWLSGGSTFEYSYLSVNTTTRFNNYVSQYSLTNTTNLANALKGAVQVKCNENATSGSWVYKYTHKHWYAENWTNGNDYSTAKPISVIVNQVSADPNEREVLVFSKLSDGTYGVMAGGMAKYEANIDIPSNYNGIAVTQILADGFKNLSSLQSITISENITTIGKNAFKDCTSLNVVNLPSDLKRIEEYAFYNCTELGDVIIFDNISFIGKYAFYKSGTTFITIPYSNNWKVTTVENDVGGNIDILNDGAEIKYLRGNGKNIVDLSDGVAVAEALGKSNVSVERIEYVSGAWRTYYDHYYLSASDWFCTSNASEQPEIEGTDGLEFYPLPDGTYAVAAGTTQYLETIVIPSTYNGITVTQIVPNAFDNAKNLKSVILPDTITIIGEYAFNECTNLSEINMPQNISLIGKFAFYKCDLESLSIPVSKTWEIPQVNVYGTSNFTPTNVIHNDTKLYFESGNGIEGSVDLTDRNIALLYTDTYYISSKYVKLYTVDVTIK